MGHIIHFGEALIANFHETHYSTQVHRYYMTISTCVSKKEFKWSLKKGIWWTQKVKCAQVKLIGSKYLVMCLEFQELDQWSVKKGTILAKLE